METKVEPKKKVQKQPQKAAGDGTAQQQPKKKRNTEKRRERSKVAARCRKGKESEIFTELSVSLPVSEQTRANLDKASVMRLTLCDLKLKEMMENVEGFQMGGPPRKVEKEAELFDSLINSAISGFVVVCSQDGDVVYVSEGIQTCLGLSQYEVMGQSLLEYSHPCDHTDVKEMLSSSSSHKNSSSSATSPVVEAKSALFRMKSANSTRGRNVHHRSSNYKVVSCFGRLFSALAPPLVVASDKKWFVGMCEPLLHPSDVDIPLNKQTFLSKHSPDMKFEYVDDSISQFLGYRADDMQGKSLFDFYHACDGDAIAKSFKSLYTKGQTTTERTRFLAKGGGWMWVLTQATTINNNAGKPTSVVCIHFVTSGVECEDEIVSHVQLGSESESVIPIRKPVSCAPAVPAQVVPVAPLAAAAAVLEEKKQPLSESTNLPKAAPLAALEPLFVNPITGPILSKPTPSTTKIFAPRTEDMDTGFLMQVNDTLIVTKEEPEDLTHLAPIAGDECVPLSNVPLLDDLLQWLDEADMEYSVMDGYDEPMPLPLINAATGNCCAQACGLMQSPIPIPITTLNAVTSTTSALTDPLGPLLVCKEDLIMDSLSGSSSCENTCDSPLLCRSTDPTLLSSGDPLLLSPAFGGVKGTSPDSPMSSPPGSCAPSPHRSNNLDFMSSDIFSTFYSDNPSASLGGGGVGGGTAGSSSHKSKAGGGYMDETFSGFPMVSDFQETLFSPSGCFEDIVPPASPSHLVNILEGGGCAGSGGPFQSLKMDSGSGGGVTFSSAGTNTPPFALISTSKQVDKDVSKLTFAATENMEPQRDMGGHRGVLAKPLPGEERPLPCKVAKQNYVDEEENNKVWVQVAGVTPTNPPWKSVACGEGLTSLMEVCQQEPAHPQQKITIGTQTTLASQVVEGSGGVPLQRQQVSQQRPRRYRKLVINPVVFQALVLSGRLIAPAATHQNNTSNMAANSRKRNFVGKLLSNTLAGFGAASASLLGTAPGGTSNLPGAGFLELPSALVELTNTDCEVNAPLNQPLLDGPEILTALDTEMPLAN